MAKMNVAEVWRLVAGIMLAMVCLFLCGGIMVLGEETLVPLIVPIAIGVAFGAATATVGWKLFRWLTGSPRFLPNYLLGLAVGGILATFAIFFINRLTARPDRVEKAVVEKVYWKQHYRTQRNGRRGVTRGAPYKTYHVRLRLERGLERNFELPYAAYLYYHKGDTARLELERGVFGMEIVGDSFRKVKGKKGTTKRVYSSRKYPSKWRSTRRGAEKDGSEEGKTGD